MCKYCEETTSKGCISGKSFNVIPTVHLKAKTNYDRLNCFILKCKKDEKAGFMIGTYEGYCYIDINYCPMCGRKIGENMENKDISRIVHNTLRRIDNYNLDIVRMKVKDIKYVLEYCVSLEKERDGIYSDYQDLGKEKLELEKMVELMGVDLMCCGADFVSFGMFTGNFKKDKELVIEHYKKKAKGE